MFFKNPEKSHFLIFRMKKKKSLSHTHYREERKNCIFYNISDFSQFIGKKYIYETKHREAFKVFQLEKSISIIWFSSSMFTFKHGENREQ